MKPTVTFHIEEAATECRERKTRGRLFVSPDAITSCAEIDASGAWRWTP